MSGPRTASSCTASPLPLYYANAEHFTEEVLAFGTSENPPTGCASTRPRSPTSTCPAREALKAVIGNLHGEGVTLVLAEVMPEVQRELDLYEITDLIGAEHIFASIAAAERAFRARPTPECYSWCLTP